MNVKREKIERAFKFLKKLGNRNILFSGISGSVSYSPSEDDDIDIFIITCRNRLWTTLLRAFLVRMLNADRQICVSLTMDCTYASTMFGGTGDYLIASDSVHVIPYHGQDYYQNLLGNSPFVQRYFPDFSGSGDFDLGGKSMSRTGLLEPVAFLLLSAWLMLKSMMHNHRLQKSGRGDECFRTLVSFHSFYFDSQKYSYLRKMAAEQAIGDG